MWVFSVIVVGREQAFLWGGYESVSVEFMSRSHSSGIFACSSPAVFCMTEPVYMVHYILLLCKFTGVTYIAIYQRDEELCTFYAFVEILRLC